MNWNAIKIFLLIIAGGLDIGWSVEYFHEKAYVRGGIFMMCAIGCVVYFVRAL